MGKSMMQLQSRVDMHNNGMICIWQSLTHSCTIRSIVTHIDQTLLIMIVLLQRMNENHAKTRHKATPLAFKRKGNNNREHHVPCVNRP